MKKEVVIDTGPFVAFFDQGDAYHEKISSFFKEEINGLRFYTTLAVLTEVTHLLDFNVRAQVDFLKWIMRGNFTIVDLEEMDLHRLIELTEKYSDVPMAFADASLVVIADKLNLKHVVSVDRDFYVYRTLSNGYLENLVE